MPMAPKIEARCERSSPPSRRAEVTPTPGLGPDAPDAPKTLSPEEKRSLEKKFGQTIQAYLDKAREDGADFSKLAKEHVDASGDDSIKAEYHKFDAMSYSEPDEAFKEEADVLRAIFSQPKNTPIFHAIGPGDQGKSKG